VFQGDGWYWRSIVYINVILCFKVMAGTGDLRVLRLCRHLGSRVGGTFHGFVTYGSHMAISMAVGLLFLGGGK
jgi:anaphase-promoting complex subunit 1